MLFKVAICDDEEKDIQTAQNFWKNMIQQEDTIFSF